MEDVLLTDLGKIRRALKEIDNLTGHAIDAELCNNWSRLPKPIQEMLVAVSEDISLGIENKVFLMNVSRDIGCLHLNSTVKLILNKITKGRMCGGELKLEKHTETAKEIIKKYKEIKKMSAA